MHIGFSRIELFLPDNHSLKGRRQVARSVTARIRNQFNVSVAEMEEDNLWQRLTLGVCCVGNDLDHVHHTIVQVSEFIERTRPDVQLLDWQVETVSGF